MSLYLLKSSKLGILGAATMHATSGCGLAVGGRGAERPGKIRQSRGKGEGEGLLFDPWSEYALDSKEGS